MRRLLAVALLLPACAIAPSPTRAGPTTAPPTAPPPTLVSATVTPAETAAPTESPVGASPLPTAIVAGPAQALAAAAQADLAARLGVDPAKIVVVSVEEQTWGDASLGCPQPGVMYAQVITPGYRIVLSDGARAYAYHTDAANVMYCEQDKP